MQANFLQNNNVLKVKDASVAGTTAITSDTVDMAGYDGVCFVTATGAFTATGTATIKVQQGAAANMSDAADLAGTAQSFADTDGSKSVAVDVKSPTKRYVRLVVTRATANSVWGQIFAVQYRSRKRPVTLGLDKYELFVSPAEGTP